MEIVFEDCVFWMRTNKKCSLLNNLNEEVVGGHHMFVIVENTL